MFWLICVTMIIQNVVIWLECRHGDVCATDQCHRQQCCVPLELTHPSDAASNRSHPVLFMVDSCCPRFYNGIYFGQGCSVDRNLEVHTGLLHYCTFGLEAAN